MNKAHLPVRARHKLETTALIHDIAATLALKDGLVNAKIEAIAANAGISRRTFFNYFPTKEDAVLGLQVPILSDDAIALFVESEDDILARTVWLVVSVIRTTRVAGSSLQKRRTLMKRFPELMGRFKLSIMAAENSVRPVITRILSDEEAEVMLNLAGAVIRYAHSIDAEMTDTSIAKSLQIVKTTLRKTL